MQKTIIIAVDEPAQRKWCLETLEKEGFRIFQTTKLVNIADLLNQYQIDIIISNQNIKSIPLQELIPLLKRFYQETRVIVFMKNYSPDNELILRLNGASYILPWPISSEFFLSIVKNTINKIGIKITNYEKMSCAV